MTDEHFTSSVSDAAKRSKSANPVRMNSDSVELGDWVFAQIFGLLHDNKRGDVDAYMCRNVCKEWKRLIDLVVSRKSLIACRSDELAPLLAYRGDLRILEWAFSIGVEKSSQVCLYAALGNNLRALKFARGLGCGWDPNVCPTIGSHGNIDALQWAIGNGCPCDPEALMTQAAFAGQIEVLQWAETRGFAVPKKLPCVIAHTGNVRAFKWVMGALCFQTHFLHYRDAAQLAARNGHIKILELMYWKGGAWLPSNLLYPACQGRHEHLVDFILRVADEHAVRGSCELEFGQAAVHQKDVDTLEWMIQKGFVCGPDVFESCRDMKILDWALRSELPVGHATILACAVRQNCVDAMEWAVSHGVTVDAAEYERLVVLDKMRMSGSTFF